MDDSKHANLGDNGLIVAAMAYRVKYRKVNSAGQGKKTPVRVESMGVHMKNRGGVYPAGIRCKSLCGDVVLAGFVKEEVNHACIAVEETPVDEIIRSRGAGMVSASTFNAENCSKDDLLSTCFQAPYDDARHMLLSHSHMMLILRAFLTQAGQLTAAVAGPVAASPLAALASPSSPVLARRKVYTYKQSVEQNETAKGLNDLAKLKALESPHLMPQT